MTKTTFSFLISFLMMVSYSIGMPIHALEQEPTPAETEEPSPQTPEEPSLTVQEESTEEPWYMGEKKEQNSLIHVENQTGFDIVSFQIKTKTEMSYPANLIGHQEVFTAETRDLYYPIQPGQEYVAQITFSDGRVVSLDPLPLADIYERFTIRFDGQQAYIDYIQASSMQPASTASVQEAQEPTEPVAEEPVAEEPVPQPEEETPEETHTEETTEEKKEEKKE
ncbi:MAG: hypothetical protein J6D18_03205, partial [Erysipelotrichaceae bacterium]|nr:hypothetical protein [Erysipelotrichaceae bacterium]